MAANLDEGKFKYSNLSETHYNESFIAKTKTPSRVKVGGTERDPYGFAIDAIDIDWGGYDLTYINTSYNVAEIKSSRLHNANLGNKDEGIISTGHLLKTLSQNFERLRTLCANNENAINTTNENSVKISDHPVKDIEISYDVDDTLDEDENVVTGTLNMTINYL